MKTARGFTLVEVMVMMAVSSFVVLGVAQYSSVVSKQNRLLSSSNGSATLISNIEMVLGSTECSVVMRGDSFSPGTLPQPIASLVIPSPTPTSVIAQVGALMGGVQLSSMSLNRMIQANIVTYPYTVSGALVEHQVNLNLIGAPSTVGVPNASSLPFSKDYPLTIWVDTSVNQIVGCANTAPASSNLSVVGAGGSCGPTTYLTTDPIPLTWSATGAVAVEVQIQGQPSPTPTPSWVANPAFSGSAFSYNSSSVMGPTVTTFPAITTPGTYTPNLTAYNQGNQPVNLAGASITVQAPPCGGSPSPPPSCVSSTCYQCSGNSVTSTDSCSGSQFPAQSGCPSGWTTDQTTLSCNSFVCQAGQPNYPFGSLTSGQVCDTTQAYSSDGGVTCNEVPSSLLSDYCPPTGSPYVCVMAGGMGGTSYACAWNCCSGAYMDGPQDANTCGAFSDASKTCYDTAGGNPGGANQCNAATLVCQ